MCGSRWFLLILPRPICFILLSLTSSFVFYRPVPLSRCDELSKESWKYCHCLEAAHLSDSFWPHRVADKLNSTSYCWILTNKCLVAARPHTLLRWNPPNEALWTGERFDCYATSYRPGDGTGDCLVLYPPIFISQLAGMCCAGSWEVCQAIPEPSEATDWQGCKEPKAVWYDCRLGMGR